MPGALAGPIRLSRFSFLLVALFLAQIGGAQVSDLHGHAIDPFRNPEKVHVLLFVRTDCPITNRYAPELRRIAAEFAQSPVDFSLVYSGRVETAATIEEHIRQYQFPGTALLDPGHDLMGRTKATVAPEAAVFDRSRLQYLGRIDDRWISFGKSRPEATVHDLEAAIAAVLAGKTPREPRTRAIGCSLEDVR
jgi:hypothetical protein